MPVTVHQPMPGTQVIQFLLAKNYYITALELLVESQQAGRLEEVEDLQVCGHGRVGPQCVWRDMWREALAEGMRAARQCLLQRNGPSEL